MQFHIKERAWTLREEFLVRDQAGRPVFKVEGKFFHIGDDLRLIDLGARMEAAHIKQKLLALTPHYEIYQNDMHLASLHEEMFHLFGEHFKIEVGNGETYHINGNLWNWDFTLSDERGNLLAQIGRRFSLFGDSYGVEIAQGVNVPLVIALAICIEMVHEHEVEKREH